MRRRAVTEGTLEQRFLAYREKRDPAALRWVFDHVASDLLGVARHLARGRVEAEDIVQETFVTALERAASWDAAQPLVPWLVGIATNVARRRLEREARAPRASNTLDPADLREPDAEATSRELDVALAAGIARLPESYRDVLTLHLQQGEAVGHIATRLERRPGTVRAQLSRGLARLRQMLPAGFALSGAALIMSPRGLAAVRRHVLAQGAERAGIAASASLVLPLVKTGGLMLSKTAVVAGSTVLALMLFGALMSNLIDRSAAPARDDAPTATALAGAPPQTRAAVSAPEIAPSTVALANERRSAAATTVAPPVHRPTTARVHVEVMWDDDNTPAVGVGVTVHPATSIRDRLSETLGALTDTAGRVQFEVLAPVRIGVHQVLGKSASVELEGGDEQTVSLIATRWGRVRGRIVDPEGEPVAGAEVWVSEPMKYDRGLAVATVGPDGAFDVPMLADNFIGARKLGHAPSYLRHPRVAKNEVVELVLPLRGPAPRLSGRVTGEDGRPIAGARVQVGAAGRIFANLEDGGVGNQAAAVIVATDTDGFYSVDNLPPGRVPVVARAPGFAAVTLVLAVEPVEDMRRDLILTREVRLFGVVRDSAGAPVHGAVVGFGAFEYVELDSNSCGSREDGSYELSGTGSNVVVSAKKRGVGEAHLTVVGEPGAAVEWNPVLDPGPVIRGFVRDANGKPLAGYGLRAELNDPFNYTDTQLNAKTDAKGAFLLTNAKAHGNYTLYVSDAKGVSLVSLESVSVGPQPIEIEIPDGAGPSASITGQVVFPEGPRGDLILRSRGADSGHLLAVDAETGRFNSGLLVPGTFDLYLLIIDGHHQSALMELDLGQNERRDVGKIRVPGRGTLEVIVPQPESALGTTTTVVVHDKRGEQVAWQALTDSRALEISLLAGTYIVNVSCEEANARKIVTVAEGATERVELRPERGRRVVLDPEVTGTTSPESIEWRVFDADGWFVMTRHRISRYAPLTDEVHLPTGTYEIRARASDGRTGSQRVDVGVSGEVIRLIVPLRE